MGPLKMMQKVRVNDADVIAHTKEGGWFKSFVREIGLHGSWDGCKETKAWLFAFRLMQ